MVDLVRAYLAHASVVYRRPNGTPTRHGIKRQIVLNDAARAIVDPPLGRLFLFGVGDGSTPYKQSSLTHPYHRAINAAGVPHWMPGQLRRTPAEIVIRKLGMEATRAMLGHSTDRLVRSYADSGEGPALLEAV